MKLVFGFIFAIFFSLCITFKDVDLGEIAWFAWMNQSHICAFQYMVFGEDGDPSMFISRKDYAYLGSDDEIVFVEITPNGKTYCINHLKDGGFIGWNNITSQYYWYHEWSGNRYLTIFDHLYSRQPEEDK